MEWGLTKKKGFRLWIMAEPLIKPYGIYVRFCISQHLTLTITKQTYNVSYAKEKR